MLVVPSCPSEPFLRLEPKAPPLRYLLATHISGHDATTGTGERQEEEGCGAQEAGSTDERVGPGVGAAEAAAELHAQAHTQDASQAGDEPKDEAGGRWRGTGASLSACKAR